MFKNSWLRRPESRRQGLILVAVILAVFGALYLRASKAKIDLPVGPLAMTETTANGARFVGLDEMPTVGGWGEAVVLLATRAPATMDGVTFTFMVKRIQIDCAGSGVRELKGSFYAADGSYVTHVNYDGTMRARRPTDVEFDLVCTTPGREALAAMPRAEGYQGALRLMAAPE